MALNNKMILKDFPDWSWIRELNEKRRYTGSFGTDPLRGCLSVHTLNYQIWVAENSDGEKEYLCASCKIQPPIMSQEKLESVEISAPFLSKNVDIIKKWICEQVEKNCTIIGK